MKLSVGIGGSVHDFATCLIDESGKFVAIEDERISRVRYALYDPNPCEASFRYVLDAAAVLPADIDRVVGNDALDRPTREPSRREVAPSNINNNNFPPLTLLNHHLTHAYSTFFTSPFDEAAVLVMDGSGSNTRRNIPVPERETMTYSFGRGNTITTIGAVVGESSGAGVGPEDSPLFQNSLGNLYRAVTQIVGFGRMHAGKTMGLAPYGDDRYVEEILRFVRLLPNGQYEIRIGGGDGLTTTLLRLRREGHARHDHFAVDASLCHAVQAAVEVIVFHALDYLWQVTKTPNLCLAGGVALNGLVNGQIAKRTNFKNVHVTFAPGDGGTAIGAAIWDYLNRHEPLSSPVRFDPGPFLGRRYSSDEIRGALWSARVVATQPKNIYQAAAQLIARGNTLAWFEGGAEFGPRALGHRSILADPRSPTMLNHINRNIKGREWFRPLAPAVTEEAAATYFEPECYSPYMQFVWPVREEYRKTLPAITHVDGSSRIQSVRRTGNESLYTLLEAFAEMTGFPILINTSFNILGAPIVETPGQAIEAFIGSELDALVLEGNLIQKVT